MTSPYIWSVRARGPSMPGSAAKSQTHRDRDIHIYRQTDRVTDLVAAVDLRCNPEDGVAVINDVTRNNIDTDSIADRVDVRIDKVCHTPTTHLCHLSQLHRSTHVTILTLTVLPTESMSGLTRFVTPQPLISVTCHNYTDRHTSQH